MNCLPSGLKCVVSSAVLLSSAAGGIIVDYTHDTFFSGNATAQASLEAAVADINAVLDLNLGAITTDMTTGVDDGHSATFDFDYQYTNPTTGAKVEVESFTIGANDIRLYVGGQDLTGTLLGQGGPGGGDTLGGSGSSSGGSTGSFAGAIADAQANDQHGRGDGPVINSFTGTLGGAAYEFDLGIAVGNLWFDTSRTNWEFDHTATVAGTDVDFYSVALHETLHALGYGASQTWTEMTSGSQWSGSSVESLVGAGASIIDGGHVSDSFMSTRLSDGGMQTSLMTSTISNGERKSLTHLDVAFIQDLGFNTTVAVPEPSSFLLFGFVLFGMCGRRRVASRQ